MDPLSIATAIVGLTATCLSTSKKLRDFAGDYADVPAIIVTICSESTIIGIGLSELQTKILRRDDLSQAWASRTEIWTAFEMALTGCMVVFSCLEAETRHLQSRNSGVWAKLKFMWNQDRLKELLGQLRGQQTSITFLLNLLEIIQKDIRQNADGIRTIAADAESLRSRTPSMKMHSRSIFDNDVSKLSLFEVEIISGVAPSELDFEFDDIVLNSKVYRRELSKAKAKHQQTMKQEEVNTTPKSKAPTVTQGVGSTLGSPKPMQQLGPGHSADRLAEDLGSQGTQKQSRSERPEPRNPASTIAVPDCPNCDKSPTQATQGRRSFHISQGQSYRQSNLYQQVVSTCHACNFPIVGATLEPKNDQDKRFHPSCYGLLEDWGIHVPVSSKGRHYIDSIHRGVIDIPVDLAIQEKHDSYIALIHRVGTEYFSLVKESLTGALLYRRRASHSLLDAESTLFVKFAKAFNGALAKRGPAFSHRITAANVSIEVSAMLQALFVANLDVLMNRCLEGASWDADNQKLVFFLSILAATDIELLPPEWGSEPTTEDEQRLRCKECKKSLESKGKGAYTTESGLDSLPRHGQSHPDCFRCSGCQRPISTHAREQIENYGYYKCDQGSCTFVGKVRFIPPYFAIACGMWLSWSVVD
ncbi:GTPase-activating protein [Fusarium heterosporum]|uniref:GTPase-activating protein n=1 Tax=Fusarium heterosporum TaxID=42747 RepID=A0A8H5U124_FUSHE|nr:GTPase-activating protein [Fusarium heterosporum]